MVTSAEAYASSLVPAFATAPVQRGANAPREERRSTLSRRERDVLRLVAAGRTDREIADALFVSQHTIANHVRHIRAKLDVATRAAAVAAAVRYEIL